MFATRSALRQVSRRMTAVRSASSSTARNSNEESFRKAMPMVFAAATGGVVLGLSQWNKVSVFTFMYKCV